MASSLRSVYIVFKEGKAVDAWSNLKYLCADMRTDGHVFPSYSKLVKMNKERKETGVMEFRGKDKSNYRILVFRVRIGAERERRNQEPMK